MAEDSDLRRRTAHKYGEETEAEKKSKQDAKNTKAKDSESSGFGFLDGLRLLAALALVSIIASYFVTRGQSFIWNAQRPWWTNPKMIKAAFAKPLELTNAELAAYDGNDPSKPILLALNRTIYDVSASPHVYGPNGMYSQLAAKDASRSYITTCFDPQQDLVPYFGGVEEVYVPLWLSKKLTTKAGSKDLDAELDEIAPGEVMEGMGMKGLIDQVQKKIGRKKSRLMREEAYAKAEERVRQQVKTWEAMFAKKEYPIVGRVVGVNETDPTLWKNLTFCEAALKQRPPLAESLGEAMTAMGSKDGKIGLNMMKKRDPSKPGARDGIPKAGGKRKEMSPEEMVQAGMDEMLASGEKGGK